MTRSTSPRCMRWPPALSTITVCGTPAAAQAPQAVNEAPWLRGRVSSDPDVHGNARDRAPCRPAPAPCPNRRCASQPALQWVSTSTRPVAPSPATPARSAAGRDRRSPSLSSRHRRRSRPPPPRRRGAPLRRSWRSTLSTSSSAHRRLTAVGLVDSSSARRIEGGFAGIGASLRAPGRMPLQHRSTARHVPAWSNGLRRLLDVASERATTKACGSRVWSMISTAHPSSPPQIVR